MSISKTSDGITIKSKFTLPWKEILGLSILTMLIIAKIHDFINVSLRDWESVIVAPIIIILIYFYGHVKILITQSDMIYKPASMYEEKIQIYLCNISKAVLTNDKFLVIYNHEGDQDYALNLRKFKRDDIQILLNLLNQKAKIVIEPWILSQEGYVINSQISLQQPSNIRHRVVNNEIQTKNNVRDSGTVSNKNLEHEKYDKDVEVHSNRRLEL